MGHKRPVYMGGQTPFGRKVAAGPFWPFLPARSWEMPVESELPAKLGQCWKKPPGHNFDFRAKSNRLIALDVIFFFFFFVFVLILLINWQKFNGKMCKSKIIDKCLFDNSNTSSSRIVFLFLSRLQDLTHIRKYGVGTLVRINLRNKG